jgi:hypothetical protein
MRFARGHIANGWLDAIVHNGRLDHAVMLLSKPCRDRARRHGASGACDAAAESPESSLSP